MIRIGSRTSPLARVQVEEILNLLKKSGFNSEIEVQYLKTAGDKDKTISLIANDQDNIFTDTLDQALLNNEIDIAIHSAKDLPKHLNSNLSIYALTQSLDSTDAFVGQVSFDDLPKGSRIGTSSPLRSAALKKLNPEIVLVDIRGTIEERIKQVHEGKYDGVIVATIALKRLGLEKDIKNIMPWEGAPLQGQLAIVGRENDSKLRRMFSKFDIRESYGSVMLVGAGPGDPGLITVKGVAALKQADIVFYDYLVNEEILKYAPLALHRNVGKRKGVHTLSQNELCQELRIAAMEGKRVVRLKGGDPLIFGRGGDEIVYLKSFYISVSIIPGVSSATAIATSLGLPLTCRDISSSVAFLSAHEKEEKDVVKTELNIPKVDTLVFMMGLSKLKIIIQSLMKHGWSKETPIVIVSRGTCVDERIVDGTIDDIELKVVQEEIKPPALIVVGETVKFWKDNKSESKTVLYTGTNPQKYLALGHVIHLPMIEIKQRDLPLEDQKRLIAALDECQKIILTSRFAVKHYFNWLQRLSIDLEESLRDKEFFVIGKTTADELKHFGFTPVFIPDDETSQGLFSLMKEKTSIAGEKFLFPRSNLTNLYLKERLIKDGAEVVEIAIYENAKPRKRILPEENIDKVIFTSPSTVRNFLDDYQTIPNSWKILSKGILTKKELEEAGYKSEGFIYE